MPTNKPSILRRSKPLFAPFYAAVGVTDRTVQALRDLGAKESGSGGSAGADLVNVVRGAAAVPALAASGARSLLDMGQAQYEEFSEHGEKTVRYVVSPTRLLTTRSSGQVSPETAASARAARRAARQAESTVSRAGSTLRSVREEAENVVEAVTHPGPIPTRHPRAGASTEGRNAPSTPRPRRPRRRPVVNDPSARSIHPSAPEEPATGSALSSVEAAGTAMPSALKRAAKKADAAAEASSAAVPAASDQHETAVVAKDVASESSAVVVPAEPEKAVVAKADVAPESSAVVVPAEPGKAAVTKADVAPETSPAVAPAEPEKTAVKKASVKKTAAKKATPRKAPAKTTTVAKAAAVTPTPTLPSAMEDLVEGSSFEAPVQAPTAEEAAAKAAEEAPKDSEQQS